MEKFELTASELMSTLNWKKSKVYYWISSGKFETVERETGTNVLITDDQIKRLKTQTISESSKESEKSSGTSEFVQENQGQNITKDYKNVSNSPNGSENELMKDALTTVQEMFKTFVQGQSFSMKLLTDGKSEALSENLELRALNKELSEKIQKSASSEIIKNCVIACVSILLLVSLIANAILSNSLIKFQTVSKMEKIEPVETIQKKSEQAATPQVSQPVKNVSNQRKK